MNCNFLKLGDIAETTSGGTPQRGIGAYYGGNIPWVKSGELPDGLIKSTEESITPCGLDNSSAKLLPAGTLLFAMYGATVGKLGILGIEATTNQAVCAIAPDKEYDTEYIFFWLLKNRDLYIKASFGGAQPNISQSFIRDIQVPIIDFDDQRRIASQLKTQLAAVEEARNAAQAQLSELTSLANAIIRQSVEQSETTSELLGDVLDEVKQGIGARWADYPVLGATRAGLALAKEPVGKQPQRYKPVFGGTVFYNPMRILIGSIALVDDDDTPGITSPDYVALRGKPGRVDSRWFYYWLRSPYGERCIASLARGAVRERMLFNRLAEGQIDLPLYDAQVAASQALAELKPMRTAIENQLKEINLLPSKILSKAFDFND